MSWKEVTKAERKHIWPIRSMQGMKNMREAQMKMSGGEEVCWECRAIAQKIGIE